MNKICLMILLSLILISFTGCSLTPQISLTYDKNEALEWPSPDLKKQFIKYWSARSSEMLEDAYQMEAPYIRVLTPFHIYKNIFTKANPIERIEIRKIESVNNRYYTIQMKIFFRMEDKSIKESFQVDKWVKPDDTWNHVRKDPILRNYFP